MTDLPKPGTKTRDVLDAFDEDEVLSSREVATRVGWAIDKDASAVSSYLRNLVKRGLLERTPDVPASKYEKTLKGRIQTEMVVETHQPIDFAREVQRVLEDENDPDSHVEMDPYRIHASQIGYCERQAYTSKLGLQDQTDILGIFQTGTIIHEFLEERLADRLEHAEFEKPVEAEIDGVEFVGQCDVHDPDAGAIYDFKTRNGWYNFDPPTQRHLDQVYVYMAATGAERGRIVYLSKGDLEIRPWPEDGFFELDEDRLDELVAKARRIGEAVEEHGVPETAEDIPFETCGCFFCSSEALRIPSGEA